MQKYSILARKGRVNRSEYQVNLAYKANVAGQFLMPRYMKIICPFANKIMSNKARF